VEYKEKIANLSSSKSCAQTYKLWKF